MDNVKIGKFIKLQRKKLNLTQNALADRLGVTFQAVSKWETGETLPDTALLPSLCETLNTSIDRLLNGGTFVVRRKHLSVANVVAGFDFIEQAKNCFGPNSTFYTGMINGINSAMNMDIEQYLQNPAQKQVLYTEAILQCIDDGYTVDFDEVTNYVNNDKMLGIVKSHLKRVCKQ